jgi:hypothetical protein
MEKVIKELVEEKDHRNKAFWRRIGGFLWRKKFSFIFLSGITYASQYYHWTQWIKTKRQRVYAKYCKRWVAKFNPTSIVYTTAMDTVW